MNMQRTVRGKRVDLHLLKGDPYGVRQAKLSNWDGSAVAGPFRDLSDILQLEAARRAGVYFLVDTSWEVERPGVYIGQSEDVGIRLSQHRGSEKDWQKLCFVTSENLTGSHSKFLESELISRVRKCGRVRLQNQNFPRHPRLQPADRDEMYTFTDNIGLVLPALGLNFLRPVYGDEEAMDHDAPQFEIAIPGTQHRAFMVVKGDEFVVLRGSKTRTSWQGAEKMRSWLDARYQELLIQKSIKKESENIGVFQKNTPFPSLSRAAYIVLGRNANGRTGWKLKGSRKSYAQWEEEQERFGVDEGVTNCRPAPKSTQNFAERQIDPGEEDVFVLMLPKSGQKAQAVEREGQFMVLKGSGTRTSWCGADERAGRAYGERYREFLRLGKFREDSDGVGVFLKDVAFGSPSTAAAFIAGRNTNGTTAWKLESDPKVTYKLWKSQQS